MTKYSGHVASANLFWQKPYSWDRGSTQQLHLQISQVTLQEEEKTTFDQQNNKHKWDYWAPFKTSFVCFHSALFASFSYLVTKRPESVGGRDREKSRRMVLHHVAHPKGWEEWNSRRPPHWYGIFRTVLAEASYNTHTQHTKKLGKLSKASVTKQKRQHTQRMDIGCCDVGLDYQLRRLNEYEVRNMAFNNN